MWNELHLGVQLVIVCILPVIIYLEFYKDDDWL